MADAGEHLGALLDLVLEAGAHREERGAGAADLLGAGGAERHRAALAEGLGGLGQRPDRLDLVAQEDHRHTGQQQAARIISTRSWWGFDTESRSRGTAAEQAEPLLVGMAMAADRELVRSMPIGLWICCRKVSATLAPVKSNSPRRTWVSFHPGLEAQPDVERQRQLRDPDRRLLRLLGGLDLLDGVGELVGDVAGHLLADPEVVPLEEHQAHHQLQRDDRNQ